MKTNQHRLTGVSENSTSNRVKWTLMCQAPGWVAVYKSSCRKGIELTKFSSLDGYTNSTATNSPEVLLSWNRRGVKLNFPGSERYKQMSMSYGLAHTVTNTHNTQFSTHPAACSHKPFDLSFPKLPRIPTVLLLHHTPGWTPYCCCEAPPPEDTWSPETLVTWCKLIA